jgi:hypothetical protein
LSNVLNGDGEKRVPNKSRKSKTDANNKGTNDQQISTTHYRELKIRQYEPYKKQRLLW